MCRKSDGSLLIRTAKSLLHGSPVVGEGRVDYALRRMQIYLPIAEISINIIWLLALGGAVGFLSGMFGVGGGFLMTPILMFIGIPPPVAVATEANQIIASSMSGGFVHWRRGAVDFKMGAVLIVGGLIGSSFGAWLFTYLKEVGQIDLMISLTYVLFLGVVGALMLVESVRAWIEARNPRPEKTRLHSHNWVHGLPFKMRFRKSRLYISALAPLAIGALVGLLAAIMGVGGGFIMVPAMIYILGMPTAVVIGTSLFQIIFVTANVTLLHSINTQTVDVLLALILLVGGVIGAQFGARMSLRMRGEQLRILLALLVLGVCIRLGLGLVMEPDNLFSLEVL